MRQQQLREKEREQLKLLVYDTVAPLAFWLTACLFFIYLSEMSTCPFSYGGLLHFSFKKIAQHLASAI